MAKYDWLDLTKRVTINASITSVFNSWSSSSGLESFFLKEARFVSSNELPRNKEERVAVGDLYQWKWHGYPDNMIESGKVLAIENNNMISFSFSSDCIVTVFLKVESGENICELMQDIRPAKESERQNLFIECSLGWTFYLANLKSILEGGVDLRNKNPIIQQLINS